MISDESLKLLLGIHVGFLAPPVIKHFKDHYLKHRGNYDEAEKKALINFVNFKKEKLSLKPAPKEIVVSLYNTMKLVAEEILFLNKEKYDETTKNLFTNEVERAWVINVKKSVADEMHGDMLWIEKTRDACVIDGANPSASDLLLFENKAKHYLRAFDPDSLPKQEK
nr:hypothetical protein [Candidatus Sigynarchaeota archaeon]